MKEVKVKLYEYDELSDCAKERAIEDFNRDNYYPWGKEVRNTIEALEDLFCVKASDWEYDSRNYRIGNIRFSSNQWTDDTLGLSGNRARAYLWNNYGFVLLRPKCDYFSLTCGRYVRAVSANCVKRTSNVFSERVFDGTCPLTGWCFDNDALEPMANFCFGVKWDDGLKKRVMVPHAERRMWKYTTVESVIRECFESLLASASRDCAYQESEENFKEMCVANDWMFNEDGTLSRY